MSIKGNIGLGLLAVTACWTAMGSSAPGRAFAADLPKWASDAMAGFDKLLFIQRQTYHSSHFYTDFIDDCGRYGGNLCVRNLKSGMVGISRGEVKHVRIMEQVPRPWDARRFWDPASSSRSCGKASSTKTSNFPWRTS